MKEKDIDDSTIDIKDINKSTIVDSNAIYNTHEEKMMKMLENSQKPDEIKENNETNENVIKIKKNENKIGKNSINIEKKENNDNNIQKSKK